jgi:hypothetical protein
VTGPRVGASRFPGIGSTGSSHPLGEATLLSPFHEADTNPTFEAESMSRLQYRGVAYDNVQRQQPSATPVDHAYRGLHFNRTLLHEAAAVDPDRAFHYRGHDYHHRAEVSKG